MLFDEDMSVEVGDPLLAFDGARQMSKRVTDIGLDRIPEEGRIMIGEIGR